jgi:hypothetical protein
VTFFATMAAAALLIEVPLDALGLIRDERNANVEASVTWKYKTVLDIAFSRSRLCSSGDSSEPAAYRCCAP